MPATDAATIERLLARAVLSGFPFNAASANEPEIRAEQWRVLLPSAEEHGLAPLLYASLKKRDALRSISPVASKALADAYWRANIANWLAYEELQALLQACEGEQIPAVVLKGPALGSTLYPDPALRPFSDLDLLFQRRDMERMSALLVAQGYEPTLINEECDDFEQSKEFARRGKKPSVVETHWHILDAPYYHARIPIEWFWERTVEFEVRGTRARGLSPEAQLLYLCAHFALHHGARRMIWSYDIALLVSRYQAVWRWDEVLATAERFALSGALCTSLSLMHDYWGVAAPAPIMERLSARRPALAEESLLRIGSASHKDVRVLIDWFGVRGWRAKLKFLAANMFPSAPYMQRRYGVRHAWLLPAYYMWRLGMGLHKGTLSALSILNTAGKAKR